jgi:hypothetical protein
MHCFTIGGIDLMPDGAQPSTSFTPAGAEAGWTAGRVVG